MRFYLLIDQVGVRWLAPGTCLEASWLPRHQHMRTSCIVLALVSAPAYAFAPAFALSPARSVQAPLRQPTRAATAVVRMADDAVDPIDRAFAAAVYLFPITDGIFFGKFLFTSVPVFGALCLPILQAAAAFDSTPAFS